MRKWIDETLHTLSVTTYHPIGWGWGRLQQRLRSRPHLSDESLSAELKAPVILLHGIFHNPTAFFRFEKRLQKKGFQNLRPVEFWTSVQSLEEMAEQLKAEVRRAVDECRSLKARIVAHSLGGMVARVALLDPDFVSRVDKVIFLVTPHQGSRLYGLPTLPRALRGLTPGGPLLDRLHREPLPGGPRYWNLRGGLDFITPRKATFLPHVPNRVFEPVGHVGLLSNPTVVETVVEILEAPLYNEADDLSP